jgi:hypothetical protein
LPRANYRLFAAVGAAMHLIQARAGEFMARIAAVVLCLAANAAICAAQARAHIWFATEMPLLNCDGIPCVEARFLNGPILKMEIDRGNPNSVLETAGFGVSAGI